MIEVKPGQVYEETDKRSGGRRIKVILVRTEHPYVPYRQALVENIKTGRQTTIALERLEKGKDYKLISSELR